MSLTAVMTYFILCLCLWEGGGGEFQKILRRASMFASIFSQIATSGVQSKDYKLVLETAPNHSFVRKTVKFKSHQSV